jgi:hypothetical protein
MGFQSSYGSELRPKDAREIASDRMQWSVVTFVRVYPKGVEILIGMLVAEMIEGSFRTWRSCPAPERDWRLVMSD